jgi:hypothetical protein
VVTFDDALPALVRVCEAAPGFTTLRGACVVRDLRGRLRLLLDPEQSAPGALVPVDVDVEALQQQLAQELGGYFAPPIWSTRTPKADEARLSRVLIQQAIAWPEAAYVDPASGTLTQGQMRWKKLERRLSKQAWLESTGQDPPWKLAASTPRTLGVLAKRKGADTLQCVVVHTFAPTAGTPEAPIEEQEFSRRSYASFARHVYGPEKAQTIGELDEGWHRPLVIRRDLRLERFGSISAIPGAFFEPWYTALLDKIEALCS